MIMNPKYSIVIPAYKSRFLSEAIVSCLAQSYFDFELIIVDDCSPENLIAIVSSFNDARIKYYRNEVNCGAVNVVDNWNKCLSYAHGDYIICMGDDDKLLPDCLSLYNEIIDKYPNLDVYHTWTQIIDEKDNIIELQESRPEWESALSMQYYRWTRRWNQYIGDFCFRTEALRREGGFYKLPLAWGSDDITVFRAAMKNGIANTQRFGFQYRQNTLTISNSGNMQIKASAHVYEWKWMNSNLKKCPSIMDFDDLFKNKLSEMIGTHYKQKILDMVEEDITKNFMHLRYWLDKKEFYRLKRRELLRLACQCVRKYKRINL